MNNPIRFLLTCLAGALVLAPLCLAAEEPASTDSSVAQVLWGILPIFFIGGILWWFLRKSQQSPLVRRSLEYYERSERHMEKMEQIGERIAAALERKEKNGV